MKKIFCLSLLILLSGCFYHNIQLTNFDTGEVLKGEFQEGTRDIYVIMPNGETLSGKYSPVNNDSFTFGSSFGRIGRAPLYRPTIGYSTGGQSSAYALLRSAKSNLLMEILVIYSGAHGYGEARTNDNRNYRVQF